VVGLDEEQDVAPRADDVARELAVVAVCRHEVRDPHPGFEAAEAQHFCGVIAGVALEISATAARMRDGGGCT
jgi:hypothetical protein